MSTQTINISPKNITGKCDLKCNYSFTYPPSNSTVTNNGIYLSFSYDKSNLPPVMYNDAKYNVSQLMIFSPSLHLFEGTNTNAEIFIEHIPELGGNNLYVCIPIIQSSDTSEGSNMLAPVIIMASNKAPADGESANLNVNKFTLNSIVPMKPFYSYQGDYFGSTADFIVYGKNYAMPLDKRICNILKKIIQPSSTTMVGGSLFFNENGPNGNMKRDGIYISCQPVNSSNEVVTAESTSEKNETTSDFNFGSLLGLGSGDGLRILISILIGVILFGTLFALLNTGYEYFTKGKIPSFSSISDKFTFGKKE